MVSLPVQTILVAIMYNQSRKGIKITDQRVRLTTEVLQGIRLIKVYGWQRFYIDGIVKLREQEIRRIGKSSYVFQFIYQSPAADESLWQ